MNENFGVIFIINLAFTIFAYLLVPTIIVLSGKKYEKKKLKKINTINCAIVWIIFRLIESILEGECSSGAAVFLWGGVGLWMLEKNCLKKTKPIRTTAEVSKTTYPTHICLSKDDKPFTPYKRNEIFGSDFLVKKNPDLPNTTYVYTPSQSSTSREYPASTSENTNTSNQTFNYYTAHIPTSRPNPAEIKHSKSITVGTLLLITVSIMFILSFVANIILCVTNVNQRSEIAALKNDTSSALEITQLKSEIEELQKENDQYYDYWIETFDKIAFFDEYVVFVADNGTNQYHKYDCPIFQSSNSFWAYNEAAAWDEGYSPCSRCCG